MSVYVCSELTIVLIALWVWRECLTVPHSTISRWTAGTRHRSSNIESIMMLIGIAHLKLFLFQVTDMQEMFQNSGIQSGVAQWNVKRWESRARKRALSADIALLRNFIGVRRVVSMRGMFHLASSFDDDLSQWETDSLQQNDQHVWGCVSFWLVSGEFPHWWREIPWKSV